MKQLDHVRHALRAHIGVASRTAKSHQETRVTGDAVANCAKAGQVNKKPLLKNRGEGIIEVGRLCECPKFCCDLGSFRCEAKEIRDDPESLLYAIFKI